ncbi:MAG TPA: FimV/HubP family polar landmark protein [Steroidobacteraceae bacterium]|nr:FimV/HubP family polar landmark protein [Steroidobacteraceae bacterium]
MSWNLRVLVSAVLLAPAAALGLGLGEIRLSSSLNEPLAAEIDLVAATPDELAALQAELASPEVFQRYGLERPAYLSTIEFSVGRGRDGRHVLHVRSRDPISEPFVSFLVDVNWSRGRLLREYTVLLDPPALAAPAERAPAPVAAPTTMPAPMPAAPAVAATAPEAPVAAEDSYTVRRGDTLYGVAGALSGGDRQATQRMMVGLFRANPEAFAGNMNVMRAGAILRVPGNAELAEITASDASSEVSRQISAWRATGGGAPGGRLRLVTPAEGAADAGTAQAESSGTVRSQIDSLQQDIEEQRRLLELRNQELARLQQELARTQAAEQAAAEQAAAEQAAAERAAAEQAAQAPAEAAAEGETAVAPEDDVGRDATPPAEAPQAAPEARPAPVPAEKGLLERLTDNWTWLLGAAAVLFLGLFVYGYLRRRREAEPDRSLRSFDVPGIAPVPSETMRLRALATADETVDLEQPATLEEQDQFLVEERPVARPRVEAPKPGVGHEETISAEAALDLDQADPLAEADFHMAYGLYDQAVDLVRMALKNAPERNDLKLKLAEIHFVAGDTPQFLTVARDLRTTLGPGADWDRIVIMGKQLAPDEPLFAGGVQDAGVDLSLEGGDNLVDVDLLSAPAGEGGLDIDFGAATSPAGSTEATGENSAIEFNLDSGLYSLATTQEIVRKDGQGTVEMPTLELPSSETPTVETPALRGQGGQAAPKRGPATDATAEMAIDDLGLDLGALENLPEAEDATAIATDVSDEATQIARHDETTRLMPRSEGDTAATAILPSMDDPGATSMIKKLDFSSIDLDVGGAADDEDQAPTVRDYVAAEKQPHLSELEPVTMSEVGTKLDLARAYMDMGDPDGARNILQEVLAEGSASQKQEARRLIDSLPGA